MPDPLRILCLSNMYPGPDDPDYGAFVATMCDALERLGHTVDRVVIDHRARGALRTPLKYGSLARRAIPRARRADVIYGHYLFPTGAIAAIAGRLARRPWVLTAHGRDVRNLTSPSLARLSAPGITGASAIVAVSRFLADELRATSVRLPRVEVANMGVDLGRFPLGDRGAARARLGLDHAGPIAVAVGGLTERKNPLRLLQAAHLVRREHPALRLVYVGDGPLAGAVRAGAARLPAGTITLTGALPNRAVSDWLAAADLLTLPSLVEPLGVVALEALATGRPVVATRVGGTAEVIGHAGSLVDPLDPADIARGMLRMLADPPTPEECRRIASAHSVDVQAARVADILASVAARPDRGG